MQNRYPFVLVIDVFVSNGILLMRKYGDFCHPWYFVREKANLKRLDYHFDKRVLCVWAQFPSGYSVLSFLYYQRSDLW